MQIRDVTDESFERDVVQSGRAMLVDFWGDNCPACRRISPILRELAEEYAGRLEIVKLHAADNPQTSARYSVRAMPTVLAFNAGQVAGQLVGARPKSAFVELAERIL